MKKYVLACMLMGCMLLMGCSDDYANEEEDYYALPENPIVFELTDKSEYPCVEYNGREYVLYGTLSEIVSDNDFIKACLGYIKNDEDEEDTQLRIWTINESEDYLMVYTSQGIMVQPDFYRAWDTKGKEIDTPAYIACSEKEIWE